MQKHDGRKLHDAIKRSNIKVTDFFSMIGVSRGTLYNYFEQERLADEIKERTALVLRRSVEDVFGPIHGHNNAMTLLQTDALYPYISVSTATAYVHNCHDALYINQMEKICIPGLAYKGSGYAFFEMEGDGMEPTLSDGDKLLAQQVMLPDRLSLDDHYIHVIITKSGIAVKRIVQDKGQSLELYSDNNRHYPRVTIEKANIKQLWIVKRRLRLETLPPLKPVVESNQ